MMIIINEEMKTVNEGGFLQIDMLSIGLNEGLKSFDVGNELNPLLDIPISEGVKSHR